MPCELGEGLGYTGSRAFLPQNQGASRPAPWIPLSGRHPTLKNRPWLGIHTSTPSVCRTEGGQLTPLP